MDAVILQGTDHFQTGAIADVSESRITMAAEIALKNPAIARAIEQCAPGLQFADAIGSFLGVKFGHARIIEVLPAAHGVREVNLPVVAFIDIGKGRRDAAFGHDGVRFAKQRLADQSHFQAAGSSFDRRPQTRSARPRSQ